MKATKRSALKQMNDPHASLPPKGERFAPWGGPVAQMTIGIAFAVIAAIGLAAEIVPTMGFARYSTAPYFATKEISQWVFGS